MSFNKKLLVLGGKPLGSVEITAYAKKLGLHVTVADYLSPELSPAKIIADEHWNISTADLDGLADLSKKNNIDGVVAGVHEFNIEKSLELSEMLGLPSYCTLEQWNRTANKSSFKAMCIEHGLDVAKTYDIEKYLLNGDSDLQYPVIIKPVDSSGSRGFSICTNDEELRSGYQKALSFSESKKVLCEEYIKHESIVAIYSIEKGEVKFSGVEDKYPKKIGEKGSPFVAGLLFPSVYTKSYLQQLDSKVKKMLQSLKLLNGFAWFEVFIKEQRLIVNEMGLRYGGSLTFYPVEHLFGINQIYTLINSAIPNLSIENIPPIIDKKTAKSRYFILPLFLKEGVVKSISGLSQLEKSDNYIAFGQLKYVGDIIENWGTGQQAFGYLHVVFDDESELRKVLKNMVSQIEVLDENGNNLLFSLFDIDNDYLRINNA